jgi:sialate O-acetylesterase
MPHMVHSTPPVKLTLGSLFADHMVLQQKKPVPVWGWCRPGTIVAVRFEKQNVSARADAQGRWQVKLKSLRAGGPHTLTVQTADETRVLRDIWVGEVYLCSGQSNMSWPVSTANDPEREIAAARWPKIRHFQVPKRTSCAAEETTAGTWEVCSPGTVGDFSAVAYFFGRELHRHLKVPIGLIHSSWGGTRIEAWIERPVLKTFAPAQQMAADFDAYVPRTDEVMAQWKRDMIAWEDEVRKLDPGNTGYPLGFAEVDVPIQDWNPCVISRVWNCADLHFIGTTWFRREVDVPKSWAGRDLHLLLGKHFDTTYFNGERIGGTGDEQPHTPLISKEYIVPGRLVKVGRSVITVRAFSPFGSGAITWFSIPMTLGPIDMSEIRPISLGGQWHYRMEAILPAPLLDLLAKRPMEPQHQNSPGVLFDGMIAPLIPYAMAGTILYQGESNSVNPGDYAELFALMIRDWRKRWKQGDFPFFFVQLAGYLARLEPEPSPWALVREAQTATLALPHTGMAVTFDLGDPHDVHPKNKQEIGRRLALQALSQIYGKKVIASGPFFHTAKVDKNGQVRLKFKHTEKGLHLEWGRQPAGFQLAAKDGIFVWAQAKMEKAGIVVWHPEIKQPTTIRYAWANAPVGNVRNGAGLPLTPFRSKLS